MRPPSPRKTAFTLVELLVVIAIIAILTALIGANWKRLSTTTQRATVTNNMRSLGAALLAYTADNDQYLPRRSTGQDDKWPYLLSSYLDKVTIYADVGDPNNYLAKNLDPLSNSQNNSSFILNGFNDVGEFTDPKIQVRMTQITEPSLTILFGMERSGLHQFYMDMLEGAGNQNDVLDTTRYDGGAVYLFADGSARYYKKNDYDVKWWLVNRDFSIPN